jgi:hypothetical protein
MNAGLDQMFGQALEFLAGDCSGSVFYWCYQRWNDPTEIHASSDSTWEQKHFEG